MQIQSMAEQIAHVNGIQLAYDTFGDPGAPPLLLIMGLGAQLISWDEAFCTRLAGEGFWVIRFDNRDVGHSTRFDHAGTPSLQDFLQAWQEQRQEVAVQAAYTLQDMAADSVGLMDALGIEAAHVVGLSLGGMIAQLLAITYPTRVRTLVSIMSMTGDLAHWSPKMEALALLLAPPPADREVYIAQRLQAGHVYNGPGFPLNEARARQRAMRNFDRGLSPGGTARQVAAVLASLGWKEQLRSLQVPTLVIHGEADPLIPVAGGIDTAETIPGARLVVIPGLGHALPPEVWPEVVTAIARHADRH